MLRLSSLIFCICVRLIWRIIEVMTDHESSPFSTSLWDCTMGSWHPVSGIVHTGDNCDKPSWFIADHRCWDSDKWNIELILIHAHTGNLKYVCMATLLLINTINTKWKMHLKLHSGTLWLGWVLARFLWKKFWCCCKSCLAPSEPFLDTDGSDSWCFLLT